MLTTKHMTQPELILQAAEKASGQNTPPQMVQNRHSSRQGCRRSDPCEYILAGDEYVWNDIKYAVISPPLVGLACGDLKSPSSSPLSDPTLDMLVMEIEPLAIPASPTIELALRPLNRRREEDSVPEHIPGAKGIAQKASVEPVADHFVFAIFWPILMDIIRRRHGISGVQFLLHTRELGVFKVVEHEYRHSWGWIATNGGPQVARTHLYQSMKRSPPTLCNLGPEIVNSLERFASRLTTNDDKTRALVWTNERDKAAWRRWSASLGALG
ncbi:hypothetical protein B0H17DRAFT_1144264 [Mycena rosella]|uniref:Uncharacterized protein n=1 Tax=Mycena rosella TaxID=1033263 RepID=A0AAD7CTT8_MYCRO|nr:hypothetical protein B0H17DRAFT_1144264 [Mycena rosella]